MLLVLLKGENLQISAKICVSGRFVPWVRHGLSDPRHRNHKSLAIANHDFEVAKFSRTNRSEIAVLEVFSESQ